MTQVRRILFFSMFAFLALFSKAGGYLGFAAMYPNDTSIVNDSAGANLVLNDPSKSFRDLFIANSEKTENYSVQLNPKAIGFVQDYMDKHTRQLEDMKDWGQPYFDLMDKILNQYGLPGELKYLAVIESNLNSNAISRVGAAGPWQLMPATARLLGLKVDRHIDERKDYRKSTRAAARYLSDLYAIYGDWLLVIAAYNGGEAHVNYAIRKSASNNFWDLQYYLPEESRNHVKKFIATHYIMEGDGGITTITKQEASDLAATASKKNNLSAEELDSSKTETISGKYNGAIIAKYIMMDVDDFNRFNPGFDKQIGSNGSFDLRLPAEKLDAFDDKKNRILEDSLKWLLDPVR